MTTRPVRAILDGLSTGRHYLHRLVRRRREPELKAEPKLTTHGCAIFWYDHGCPNKYGQEITVDMQSGRQAIYKLATIRQAHGTDWCWYDFDFVRYLQPPTGADELPAPARKD